MRGLYCSQVQLVKRGELYDDVKPLPCRSWTCELCAPGRRRQLIAQAASGEPNKILTLTISSRVGSDPVDRHHKLHDAWKRLVKRILRQFAWPPARRWQLKTKTRSPKAEAIVRSATALTPQRGLDRLHYFAFLEATKRGEPHLHILLRCPYLPQDWLSEQLAEMIGSPVVWIEQIHSTRKAISYVTKYVTKAPARFGNSKRYWVSKGWEVNASAKDDRQRVSCEGSSVRFMRWDEFVNDTRRRGAYVADGPDGWCRVWRPGSKWKAQDLDDTWRPSEWAWAQ